MLVAEYGESIVLFRGDMSDGGCYSRRLVHVRAPENTELIRSSGRGAIISSIVGKVKDVTLYIDETG